MKKLAILALSMGMVAVFPGCETTTTKELTEIAKAGAAAAGYEDEKTIGMIEAGGKTLGGLLPMSLENQVSIGYGVAVQSFDQVGRLHPNEDLQRYVNMVGRTVARKAQRSEYPYTFAVVESPNFNAWAAPGGYIFITTATLEIMDDESELAGVLAHEVAHVSEHHMITMLKRNQVISGIFQGATSLDESVKEYSQAVDLGTDILFEKGLDRGMELESDVLGARMATAAGYDPEGLLRFLYTLKQNSNVDQGGGWLTSTHPSLDSRIERLERLIQDELYGYQGQRIENRFKSNVTNVLGGG